MAFRFNGGNGAILCDTCGAIFLEPACQDDSKALGDFCAEHASVVPLDNARRARELRDGQTAYEQGRVFRFQHWDYNDQVGLKADDCVCVLFSPEIRAGICMSRNDAIKLAHALVQAAESKQEELPQIRPGDMEPDNG